MSQKNCICLMSFGNIESSEAVGGGELKLLGINYFLQITALTEKERYKEIVFWKQNKTKENFGENCNTRDEINDE